MAAVVMVTGKRVGGLSYALQPLEWPEFSMVEETRAPETMHPLCWVCTPHPPFQSTLTLSPAGTSVSLCLVNIAATFGCLSESLRTWGMSLKKKKKRFPKAQNAAAEGRKTLWLASRNERFEVEML